ncbi:AAA family ATPase [Chitinophaga sp. Mgbs1]|uniref:AAA family ATPase n=1 Tax=Chitinophaga solisilvae TaxID=1233460 RepID=A0A3S1CME1_9BACT|nr:AAA family ATPase [Chitinophaga solisilvae]
MNITQVILSNWKNFKSVNISLADRVFIVGANAAGKSNFLDVFRFLRDIVKQAGGLQNAVQIRGGISKIRSLAARRDPVVSIEIHLGKVSERNTEPRWKYILKLKSTGGGIIEKGVQIVEERVYDGTADKWILNRKNNDSGEDSETLRFTHLEQPTSNQKFREIYHFLQETQYLHVVPQLIRDSDSYLLAANKEDFYGRNLLERMGRTTKKTRDSYLKKINEVLKLAVPQLENVNFVQDKNGVPHLEAVYKHWRPNAGKQQEDQFSDGTLRLIGFMWALLDGQETILLEEPELYLNVEIVKLLPEFIYKMQRRRGKIRQVIISTHSYDMLNGEGIGAEEALVLIPGTEGTEIKMAKDLPPIVNRLEAGATIAESIVPMVAPRMVQGMLNLKD